VSGVAGLRLLGRLRARAAAAETYLLITRLTSWDLDAYRDRLATTSARRAGVAEGNS
jgi:hypothetical protein